MFCPQCGRELPQNARFCDKCGTALSGSIQAVESDLPPTPPQPVEDVRPTPPQPAEDYRPTPPQPPEEVRPTPPQPPQKPKRNNTAIVLAAVAAALVVAIVLVVVLVLKPGAPTPDQNTNGTSATAKVAATSGYTPSVTDPKTGQTITAIKRPMLTESANAKSATNDYAVAQPKAISAKVEPGLSNVINLKALYLPDDVKPLIEKYGFAVDGRWGSDEFFELYEQNRYDKTPNFVTVDSLMHTYHLYFQHLQKNTERDHLASTIQGMSQALLKTSEEQLKTLKGTEWENAAKRNVAFFAVGASLQDASTQVPSEVKDMVDAELANIQAASGIVNSAIIGTEEDYSQYIVRGYYEGDDVLERYFRTMMWYGRLNFKQRDEDLDRSALLMTMALQGDALERWKAVYSVTSFFAGASDDCGYYEYQPLFEAAYGEGATVADLAGNNDAWQHFHTLSAAMPAPQINSVPFGHDDDPNESRTDAEKGFRLMGQRFSLDEMIFNQLVTPQVGKNSSGAKRNLPNAVDVPAALGSDEALAIMESRGAAEYENYSQNMQQLREELSNEDDPRWQASLYSQWLYTINPLLAKKGEGFPSFMQSSQWARKSLQSYLGSYTELKHDTVLYAKQIMAEGGGGPNDVDDDRGYVEPEPTVFGRLANLTAATKSGLEGYGLLGSEDAQNLDLLNQLASQMATIAQKELTGDKVSDDEFELIRSYGEQLEHFWQEVYKGEAKKERFTTREFPCAVVTDIATDGEAGTVLEVGTGKAKKLYVAVEIDGKVRIASGTVFSFYQFEQPLSERLTDTKWRQMMGIEPAEDGKTLNKPSKQLEDWTNDFTANGS